MSRLLIIDPGLQLWGSERALLATVPDLVAVHDMVVAVVPHRAALAPRLAACGVTVYERQIDRLGQRSLFVRAQAVLGLIALCLRYRIDVIYLNQAGLCRVAGLVARLLGRRLVVHVRIAEDLSRVARLRASSRSPVDAILISRDMLDRFSRSGDRSPHVRIHLAYDLFEPDDKITKLVRSDDSFVCLGRIAAIKGQRELIEAFALLTNDGLAARLDLIGSASQEPAYGQNLREAVARSGLEDRVTFLGFVDDAAENLGRYAFVVVPSRYEPLGRIILEGWAAGCVPICSAESGGGAEILSLSGGGLTYAGADPASLADAMRRALALTPDEREGLARKGRQWMRNHTSATAYRTALSNVLFPQRHVSGKPLSELRSNAHDR